MPGLVRDDSGTPIYFESLAEAQTSCLKLIVCKGITSFGQNKFELRSQREYLDSHTGEKSWRKRL